MNETSRIWRAQRPLGWSPFWGTGSPSSRGWRLPLPIERPLLEHIQVGTVPGSQRGCPPPALPPPLPQPQRMQFTLCIYYCSRSVSLPSPWEEPAGWQLGRNLLSPLRVPASPLISAWTPCARAGHSRTWASPGCPESLRPSRSWGPAAPGSAPQHPPLAAPWQGWRSEQDQQAGERSGLRRGESFGWGWL